MHWVSRVGVWSGIAYHESGHHIFGKMTFGLVPRAVFRSTARSHLFIIFHYIVLALPPGKLVVMTMFVILPSWQKRGETIEQEKGV